ncbi:flavin reductase family protein [Streptomyces venezuelae]|uniref:flavin reductase family protein n=1 Tax=Streptomyces venezuelae TaxID=54571 RepID=UPI00278BCF08|nr:flavin reductase family protein [Streptomyces venezuelae]
MTEPAVRTPPAPQSTTAGGFRAMMSGFPTGVCIVTCVDPDGTPRGMTCSSLCSVSLDPPTLLVCLRVGSPTLQAVLDSGGFTVNLLHDGAREAAELFASGDPERFRLLPWERAPGAPGPHLVRDAHTIADCKVTLTQRTGDHVTVFGETLAIRRQQERPPLLYGLREFRSWPAA